MGDTPEQQVNVDADEAVIEAPQQDGDSDDGGQDDDGNDGD